MGNYRRPRDVAFPAPGPVPEHIRKATIRRIIQQQQQEKIEKEKNTSKNILQNSKVSLQQEKEESDNGTVTTKPATSSEINGIDHYTKINGHSNAQEINNGENDDQTPIDHENDESEILNSNENILNNKINNGSAQETISSQNEDSLNKEPINPEPPPEPPDDENGESSNNKKDSGKSILKGQNDEKEEEEEEEEESSDDSLPDEKTIIDKLEELTAKKRQLWQQLRDAKAKQAKKEQAVTNNETNHNLREETTTDYNTGMHDQSYRVDKHNMQSNYISSNRDHYDSSYLSSYHHEGDIPAFHHQIPLGIKRMNEQTSPPIGSMNKRIRYPSNGMHYESMNHGASSMYGPPPTGPSAMTGNGMMGRGREDSYSYYHREFRPPPPNAPYLDRSYVRGQINNMQRRLSGNPSPRPSARPPDRPRGRY